jgi:hypothetical protein
MEQTTPILNRSECKEDTMGYLNAKYAQRTSQKISAGNDVTHAPRQMPEIERLGDHVHAGPKKAFGVCGIFGIAGHEENFQIRS